MSTPPKGIPALQGRVEVKESGLHAREGETPTGTVTFLFTDIEGSTRLRATRGQPAILAPTTACCARRSTPTGARSSTRRATRSSSFSPSRRRRRRGPGRPAGAGRRTVDGRRGAGAGMGLHTGEADLGGADYLGLAVNRGARLRPGHGGQVLLSQATRRWADGAARRRQLSDLGEHRLKDLARPERVFQLVAPGLPADFPPLRRLDALPHNLPLQLTSFVGRERELAAVAALLAAAPAGDADRPGRRGQDPPGAAGGGRRPGPAYPDGVWLVELAPLADPALVPAGGGRGRWACARQPGRPLAATLADGPAARAPAAGAGQLRAPARRLRPPGRRPAAGLPRPCASWPPAGRRWASPARRPGAVPLARRCPAPSGRRPGRRWPQYEAVRAVRRAGRGRAARLRADRRERRRPWPRSAGGWTASPWPSSWPPRRVRVPDRRAARRRGWTTASGC